jgi:hypothetical protein
MTTTFYCIPLMAVNISANDGIILPFVSISTFTKQIDSTLRLCFQSTLSYNAHFIQTNLIQLFWCDLSMTVNVMVLLIVNFYSIEPTKYTKSSFA